MLPQFSYALSTSSNVNICQVTTSLGALVAAQQQPQNSQLSCQPFDLFCYYILAGSTGVGTVLTFQALGADSTSTTPVWRALATPAAITLANSTPVNGVVNGPFHGLRIAISGVVGNGVAYAEIIGSVRTL